MSNKNKPGNDQQEVRGIAGIAKAIREHTTATRPEPQDELQKRDRKHLRVQWAGVIIASVYAGLTLWLLLVTKDAVNLTREQVHVGQRAYLMVVKMKLEAAPEIGKGLRLTYDLRNTGQTPAINVSVQPEMDFFIGEPPPADRTTKAQTTFVGAGQSQPSVAERITPLTAADVANMEKPMYGLKDGVFTMPIRDRRYFVYGVVNYTDVFGGHNQTEFCLVYLPTHMQTRSPEGDFKAFGLCTAPERNSMK